MAESRPGRGNLRDWCAIEREPTEGSGRHQSRPGRREHYACVAARDAAFLLFCDDRPGHRGTLGRFYWLLRPRPLRHGSADRYRYPTGTQGTSACSLTPWKMRADATPFVTGQICRVSFALHGAKLVHHAHRTISTQFQIGVPESSLPARAKQLLK